MRLKADLSLPNSQHFTTWNKITQGSCSARSKLHTPPRRKASGWNGLEVQHDCISQVRSCWRWFSALSQQSMAWYRLHWRWCRAPCLNKSLGKHLGWESSPDTYSLCSHFHISTKDAAISLWGSLPYSALNDRHLVLSSIYRDYAKWVWEDEGKMDDGCLCPSFRHVHYGTKCDKLMSLKE